MSILPRIAKTIGARLARLQLPQDCFVCAAPSGSALLCEACLETLPRLADQRCPSCALPSAGGALCGACLKSHPHFDATMALHEYAFPISEMIVALKYRGALAVAAHFSAELCAAAKEIRADAIVPLPLHRTRLAERGFNQAVELARPLARTLQASLLVDEARRERDTAPQAALPWDERRRNVRGAFRCDADLSGRSVVVVDDVMTTGASLDEFARILKKRGALRVTNCVIARTLRNC